MGLFNKRSNSDFSSRTITHTANWGQNSANFYVKSNGVSWDYFKAPDSYDEMMTRGALSQIQKAYHLPVSHPQGEASISSYVVDLTRVMKEWNIPGAPDIKDPSSLRPSFRWNPPLPT